MSPPAIATKTTTTNLSAITAFQIDASTDKAERREQGRRHTSAVLIHILNRNDWSHPDMEKLATWALNEDGALHTSQVSHLKNGKTRLMGMKCLDALGQINIAVWAYNNGHRDLLKKLGVAAITESVEELISNKEAILNPHTELPIDQGDWLNIYLGLLTIPNVVNGPEGDVSWAETAASFGVYINLQLEAAKIKTTDAVGKLTEATGDADLAARLVMAACEIKPFDANELTSQLPTICDALNKLDGGDRTPQSITATFPWKRKRKRA